MSTTNQTISKRHGGVGKGIFLALLIIIVSILIVALVAVVLTGPGKAQLRRLKESQSALTVPAAKPELTGRGMVVEIPEETLSKMLSSGTEIMFAGRPEVNYMGLDLKLADQEIDVLSGVEGQVPGIGWRRAAVMQIRAELGVTEEGLIRLTPKAVRFGMLPIPIKRLIKLTDRIPDFHSVEEELADLGVIIDSDSGRFFVDPEPWLSGYFPGMQIKQIRAVRGALRIALGMPASFDDSLAEIFLTAARNEPDLIRRLDEVLPAENLKMIESVEGLFEAAENYGAVGKEEPMEAAVSYVEGRVDAIAPGSADAIPVDFGDRLTIGTTLRSGKDSYAELVLTGRHITKVGEQSELVVSSVDDDDSDTTSLALLKGKVRVLVSSLSKDEIFELTTTDTVMAVRGTDFVVILQRNGAIDMAVLEGRVSINDEVTAEADQSVSVGKGRAGVPIPISDEFRAEIEEDFGIRTLPEDLESLSTESFTSVAMPHIMSAASVWAGLDNDTQWEIQNAIVDYMEENPEIPRTIDEFFRVNGWEDRRGEFERMFE
ncbi:MAG: FecR family protein [Spirochaetaceae bacterium]|nr:FecR family protein [Spirochaetaceae bacterium]MDT8297177.1 FecR family protein [Spirochaetaceae bacterium]